MSVGEYIGGIITGQDFTGEDLEGVYIGVDFIACRFNGARLAGDFTSCTFDGQCTWRDVDLDDGTFVACRGLPVR